MIMPLANSRDKRTQVIWGIKDFIYRFHREPEGMWLAETAVDLETLDIMTEFGIKFTILSPYQAKEIRKIGSKEWHEVSGGKVDPKIPYFCSLPSGRSIAIFFYDGPISQDVAFGGLLNNGENFANRLLSAFAGRRRDPQLMHIATDGETYGHHHHFGEMAMSYGFHYIKENKLATLTVYGEFLEKFPPIYEVRVFENSSWSCFHGVERWRSDCGCRIGNNGSWNQKWRGPLREAMDWLRDNLSGIYEELMRGFTSDPWQARNNYIDVVLNRSEKTVKDFIDNNIGRELSGEEKSRLLKLMEMQRNAMLMFTSCGWFFDEISGIEGVQVMQYAARAMQLAREVSGRDLEPDYIKILEKAPSNIEEFENGGKVYEKFVKPIVLDLLRVGAHYAISSLFTDYPQDTQIYCYSAKSTLHEQLELGKQKVAVGTAKIKSLVTYEESTVSFAALHLGDHNLIGGVRGFMGEEAFAETHRQIKEAFEKNNVSRVIKLINDNFGEPHYSLWHLFKDEQRRVMRQLLSPIIIEIENSFRQINEHHYPTIRVMKDMGFPLPKVFSSTMTLILNTDIQNIIESEEVDLGRLDNVLHELTQWALDSDKTMIGFVASKKISKSMKKLQSQPENVNLLNFINEFFRILRPLRLEFSLWKAQNIHFAISKTLYSVMQERANRDDKLAQEWVKQFNLLGDHLKVRNS